jgi:hypothetical protein
VGLSRDICYAIQAHRRTTQHCRDPHHCEIKSGGLSVDVAAAYDFTSRSSLPPVSGTG